MKTSKEQLSAELKEILNVETDTPDDILDDMRIFLLTKARVAVKGLQNGIQDEFLDETDSEEIIEAAREASLQIAQSFDDKFADKYIGRDEQFEDMVADLELEIGGFIIDTAVASLPRIR